MKSEPSITMHLTIMLSLDEMEQLNDMMIEGGWTNRTMFLRTIIQSSLSDWHRLKSHATNEVLNA